MGSSVSVVPAKGSTRTDNRLALEARLADARGARPHGEEAAGERLVGEIDALRPDRGDVEDVERAAAEGDHARLGDGQADALVDLAGGRHAPPPPGHRAGPSISAT